MTEKLLVVDACVARSAGMTEHPVSANCRALLITVQDCGHRIRLQPALLDEWQRHMSRFARTWLVRMMARRKVVTGPAPCPGDVEVAIARRIADAATLAEVNKDLHLVGAAIASDKIVISLDDKVRQYLAQPAREVAAVGAIMWDNPCEKPASTAGWLKDGAPLDHSRRLANHPAPASR
jgi:hypothetical protein